MAKGDDYMIKKKNKALRKKASKESSVSTRVAAIIAAKKRRQTGKRRQCQGMCFSLPTAEDPFNDRDGKPLEVIKGKKNALKRKNNLENEDHKDGKGSKRLKVVEPDEELEMDASHGNMRLQKIAKLGSNGKQLQHAEGELVDSQHEHHSKVPGVPSKFLVLCLKSIQDALLVDGGMNVKDTVSLFANPWGGDFWKCYSAGKNVLETSLNSPNLQQIAWIVATAADNIARKEKEGDSYANPFLLYLVPSQEVATKVRSVCKPLKALGIHTVSLHPGALIDHQINGLKSCEPEFLVATPERLQELISLKAIDISAVSLLVLDGMDMFTESGCSDVVKHIIQSISKVSRAVVFQGHSSVEALKSIITFREPFCKLSLDDCVKDKRGNNQSMHPNMLKDGKRLNRGCLVKFN